MRTLSTLVAFWVILGSLDAQIFNRKSKDQSPTFEIPRSLETKFDLSGGLIFIPQDQEEKRTSSFLLDTGAPTLILNQLPVKSNPCLRVVGVNGMSSVSNTRVKNFAVQGMSIGNLKSYLTDLSEIERIKEKQIKGILGYKVLKPFELFIDYDRQYLMLFEKGASDLHTFIKPVGAMNFTVKGHFPVVKVKIGKRKYYFGIDTGAEVNVINKNLERKLTKYYQKNKTDQIIQGLGSKPVYVSSAQISSCTVDGISYEQMEFVFADLEGLNAANGFELDGILGFPFLSSGKFSISYKDKKLYVWDDPIKEADAIEFLSQLE